MKLQIQKSLSGGQYHVSFQVSDFSQEEVKKMESFGIPQINLMVDGPLNRRAMWFPLNRITFTYKAGFEQEAEARSYEKNVQDQIKAALQDLRGRKDDFSSMAEVEI